MRLVGAGRQHRAAGVLGREEHAQRVGAQHVHEALRVLVPEQLPAADARVGEEDVQAAVRRERLGADGPHGGLVGGVELPRVDGDAGVQRLELALVRGEVRVGEVAEVDGAGAVARELMC